MPMLDLRILMLLTSLLTGYGAMLPIVYFFTPNPSDTNYKIEAHVSVIILLITILLLTKVINNKFLTKSDTIIK